MVVAVPRHRRPTIVPKYIIILTIIIRVHWRVRYTRIPPTCGSPSPAGKVSIKIGLGLQESRQNCRLIILRAPSYILYYCYVLVVSLIPAAAQTSNTYYLHTQFFMCILYIYKYTYWPSCLQYYNRLYALYRLVITRIISFCFFFNFRRNVLKTTVNVK